ICQTEPADPLAQREGGLGVGGERRGVREAGLLAVAQGEGPVEVGLLVGQVRMHASLSPRTGRLRRRRLPARAVGRLPRSHRALSRSEAARARPTRGVTDHRWLGAAAGRSPHVTTRQVQVVPGGPARHSCVVNLSLVDRCAQFARAQTLDPSGTAGSYRGYVAIDVPLPWPNDIAEHPTVAPVAGALASAGVRVQGTVPDPSDGEGSRMVTFLRPPGPFVAYEAATWRLAPGDATAALAAIAASATAGGALDGGPATLVAEGDAAGRLVLVCTHG